MRLPHGFRWVVAAAWIAAAGGCGRGPAQEAAAPAPRALAPEDVAMRLQGIAGVMIGTGRPAVPHRPGTDPPFNGEPSHLRFRFDTDSLSPEVDYRQRQLLVYPLEEYRKQFSGAEQDSFDARLERFRALIQTKPTRVNDPIPVLPAIGPEPTLQARIRYFVLQDGHGAGVRFIAYREHAAPGKRGLFYTFQGIVGNHYVSLFWPITAPDLPEGRSASKAIDFIRGLTDEEMNPPLGRLDQALESLLIQEPGPSAPAS